MNESYQSVICTIDAELRTSDGRLNGRLLRSKKYEWLRNKVYELSDCLDKHDELTHRVYWILLGYITPPTCRMCNNRVRFQKQTQRFNTYCCSKCRQADPVVQDKCKNTNLIRYGVEYITTSKSHQDQARLTNLARYGAEKPFQSSTIQDKVRQTTFDKYGVVSTALLPNIKEKQLATRQQKYGVDYLFQSQEFQEQVKLQTKIKYNGKHPSQLHISDISLNHLNDYNWIFNKYCIELNSLTGIAEELGVSQATVANYVELHNIPIRETNTFSSLSINWLNGIMVAENINIQHALNGGEYVILDNKNMV